MRAMWPGALAILRLAKLRDRVEHLGPEIPSSEERFAARAAHTPSVRGTSVQHSFDVLNEEPPTHGSDIDLDSTDEGVCRGSCNHSSY